MFDAVRPEDKRDAFGVQQARALLDNAYYGLNEQMADRTWACGADFSLADCGAAPALPYADWTYPIPQTLRPVWAYRTRLLARAAYERILNEARPYRHYFPLGAPEGRD